MTAIDPTTPHPTNRLATRLQRRFVAAVAISIAAATSGFLIGLPSASRAADVLQEINHTCAVNEGCFAGDAAGYPVTISATGRYRLTGNLVIPDAATVGISIAADHVDLDLSGFVVRGPVVCSGVPLVCTPSNGTAAGIASTPGRVGVRVRNGVVRGAGFGGIALGAESTVEDVRVRSNGGNGIVVGDESKVSGAISSQNENNGVVVRRGSVVSECVVSRNAQSGLVLGAGTGGDGSGAVISASLLYQNEISGIFTSEVGVDLAGATVTGNVVYDNGFGGIVINQGGNAVSGNVVVSNTDTGLLAGASSVTDNTVAGNGLDVHASTGSFLGGNSCGGTATCP